MKFNDYLAKHKNKLNNLQVTFLENVFFNDFGEEGLNCIVPEVEIYKPDGTGTYKIDFVITTSYAKYAVECDGLYYHAEGAITKEYFDHLQAKQNEIISQGFRLIRFTNNLIRTKPEECIWELRRNFIADEQLFKIYLGRMGSVEPHEVQRTVLDLLNNSRKVGNRKGLVILATGLGKTYLAAFDVKQFKPKKVLFVVHVNEILKQSLNSFQDVLTERINEMGYFIGPKKELQKNILFASQ